VVSGQWSVISGQWSVISDQWSVISGQSVNVENTTDGWAVRNAHPRLNADHRPLTTDH